MLATKSKESAKSESEHKSKDTSASNKESKPNPIWNILATSSTPRIETPNGGSIPIQSKFTISQPNDPYEREADLVADHVMRMPESVGEAPYAVGATGDSPYSKVNITPKIYRKAKSSEGIPGSEGSLRGLGSGQSLSKSTKSFFETLYSADFSQVRIHTDGKAAESARAIQARAFTNGKDVVFGAGEYVPESQKGRRLLAHELMHVLQLNRNGIADNKLHRSPDRSTPATPTSPPTKPSIDAQVASLFEQQVKSQMASAARTRMLLCVDVFRDAVDNTIRKESDEAKALAENPGLADMIIDMALGALVPGIASVVLSRVKDQTMRIVSDTIEIAMKSKTIGDSDHIAVIKKIDEKVDELAKKIDGPAAKKLITALATSNKAIPAPGIYAQSEAEEFLIGLKQRVSELVQTCSDNLDSRSMEEIAAVMVAYDVKVNTQGVYEGQIRELLAHYKEVKGGGGSHFRISGGNIVVYLDVWGGRRLAVLKVKPGRFAIFPTERNAYTFVRYVPAEEEDMTKRAAGGEIKVFDLAAYQPGGENYNTSAFIGHIPQPDVETPFIAEVNAWGSPRLAHVAFIGGKPKFVSWVSAEQVPWERVKAQSQAGKLRQYMDRELDGPIPRPGK